MSPPQVIALYTFCFTFFVGSLACFHLFLITQGLTTYLWFKDTLDKPVELRGGDTTGFRQCARSTRAVARPFSDSGAYFRWRRSFRTTPENEMRVSEVELGSKPWSFRDLYDDVVRPSSSYSAADEQPRPLDSDAASAAAQMEAFAASGVAAAVAVAAQCEENARKTAMAAKEPDHVSDVEAPSLTPSSSVVAGEADAAGDGTAVDKETDDSSGPPATAQREQPAPAEDLRTAAEQEQEDAHQDEARP